MDIKFNEKINASPATIWAAAGTEKGIQSWWCQNSKVAEELGGEIVLNFVKDGSPVVMEFKVDQLSPNEKVVWTCTNNGNPAWINTTLTFIVAENGDFSFIHGNFDEKLKGQPAFENTADGWKHFIASFKSYCETGEGQPW